MSAITPDGNLVHYEVLGRGRPVILLHGWIGSWRYWVPTMQALQSKYRLYALDLYGYGDSAKNPNRYTLEHQIALLDDFVKALGIPKAALIGHGLGALVAAEYARRYPDRIPRLLVISAPLYDPGDLDRRVPIARQLMQREIPEEIAPGAPTIVSPSTALQAAALVAQARAKRGGHLPPELEAIAQEVIVSPAVSNPLLPLIDGSSPDGLLSRCYRKTEINYQKLSVDLAKMDARALRGSIEHFDAGRLLDTFRMLTMPVAMMHGLDDPLIAPPQDEVWHYLTLERENQLVPILLPGTRHFPMLDDERFLRLVADFLEATDMSKLQPKERWRRRTR
jgi:pimeloyl-ACP methyl ester carboxylesterase